MTTGTWHGPTDRLCLADLDRAPTRACGHQGHHSELGDVERGAQAEASFVLQPSLWP